jgi:hypothetical protein
MQYNRRAVREFAILTQGERMFAGYTPLALNPLVSNQPQPIALWFQRLAFGRPSHKALEMPRIVGIPPLHLRDRIADSKADGYLTGTRGRIDYKRQKADVRYAR